METNEAQQSSHFCCPPAPAVSVVSRSPVSILGSSMEALCWESIWHAKRGNERETFSSVCGCSLVCEILLASSRDSWVETCLSFVSANVDDWLLEACDLPVDPLENFSRRRRRSLKDRTCKAHARHQATEILHQVTRECWLLIPPLNRIHSIVRP